MRSAQYHPGLRASALRGASAGIQSPRPRVAFASTAGALLGCNGMARADSIKFAGFDKQAWLRFFIAIAGLLLAFLTALYSTVLRESGHVIPMAIAASASLLIAGAVGLYTVPYLAKRVALENVRDVFDFDVTTEGIVYLGTALVVGVAALNTGNNLLFIVVAAMLAAIMVSGIAVLRGLRLDLSIPVHVFAGQGILARLKLRNRFWFPSFSVTVVPPRKKNAKRYQWQRGTFAFPPNRPPEKQWVRWPDLQFRSIPFTPAPDAIFDGSVYFPYIASKSVVHADVDLNFARRGRYVQDGFGLATRFPFSFLVKTKRVVLEREVIVFPSVEPTDDFFDVLPLITGEMESFVRGRGNDLYRIRDLEPGDPARTVDWKATAKSGSLKVREFTREDERRLRIVFDNPLAGSVSHESYESGVQLAASLAWHFAEGNAQLSFAASGLQDGADLFQFLRYLALVQPAQSQQDLHLQSGSEFHVIITASRQGSIPAELWSGSYVLYMDRQR